MRTEKHLIKRRLALWAVVAIMLISAATAWGKTYQVAKETELTVTIGEKVSLSGKSGMSWKSSNKKVAKITKVNDSGSKATVQAKSSGDAVITAKKGKTKYRITIHVVLDGFTSYATPAPTPTPEPTQTPTPASDHVYVLNLSTKKVHEVGCSSVEDIKPENYSVSGLHISELEAMGYSRCKKNEDGPFSY